MTPSQHLTISILLCLSVAGCQRQGEESDSQASDTGDKAVVSVRVAPVRKGSIDILVSATGQTDALRKEKVFSPIAGRVLSLKVLEGARVEADEVIAVVQSKESQAAIAGSQALLQSAKTPAEKAEAGRTLALAESTQSKVTVRAKFAGIVAVRSVAEGELVQENTEIVTLLDLSTLTFVANIPLNDLSVVRIGQKAVIVFQALPNLVFSAAIDAISPQSDQQSQTLKVRLRFTDLSAQSQKLLKTDMAGIARIVVGMHTNAFSVPRQAILRNDENGTSSIVIMTPDSLSHELKVETGARTDSSVEVISHELREGLHVITEGK